MSEYEQSMEFTGASVEEAIERGLKALGISREQADIHIIEEGSRGLFGLGSRDAAVRITPLSAIGQTQPHPGEVEEMVVPEPVFTDDSDEDEDEFEDDEDFSSELTDDDEVVAVTRETVIELLQKMHVSADVSARMSPKDPFSKRAAVEVDITGDDLSIIIGRKAETLDALQYITRLIVGKELNRSVIINIDVQGYKKRKEQRLRRIAQSVARQAIETGRRQYLEPMSAWDRRIVHMELRNNPGVYTESVGEGNRRKVTINPRDS